MKTEREYQTHRAAAMLVIAAFLWPCSALLGGDYRVLSVYDGDTIKVQKEGGDPISVRLAEIDAPELKQPHGLAARDYLRSKVADKEVDLKVQTKDRYGRVVAVVILQGSVNAAMVRDGWAWHYKQYSRSEELAAFEKDARRAKRGLWKDPRPTPPWSYRASQRKKVSMHYRNGREAKNGDKIVKLEGGKVVSYGVLHSAVPGNDYCNGNIAAIQPVNDYACMCDCLHVDDVAAVLAKEGLDKRPEGK